MLEAQLLWKSLRLGLLENSGLKARQAFKGSTHHYPLEYNLEKIKHPRKVLVQRRPLVRNTFDPNTC